MNSNKSGIGNLKAVLRKNHLRDVVICPGSRNAPLIMAFTSDPYFTCYSIVDERSAGFFALGLSQISRKTTAVICTSGSALLNLAPAVAEAYYQRLPLLVLSADRPREWVNQGESQTLDQAHIFSNYIRASYDLVQEPGNADDLWFHGRQISEAVNQTLFPPFGPVHINMRFREPLYDRSNQKNAESKVITQSALEYIISSNEKAILRKKWSEYGRIMVICGQHFRDAGLSKALERIAAKNVVVLTESTSNVSGKNLINCIDRIVIPSDAKEKKALKPDLLITIGGPLISRKIKSYLREYQVREHWHADLASPVIDAYQRLTRSFGVNSLAFLRVLDSFEKKEKQFIDYWKKTNDRAEKRHGSFLQHAPFSDLVAFHHVLSCLPDKNLILQIGNSASIRYQQLFDVHRDKECFSNRGTSGIEGSVSTAVGASVKFKGSTFLILGDLSLLYDSNGLWNEYLSSRLKIIVINNQGGGIFRILEGPDRISGFEKYIENHHNVPLSGLTGLFGLNHYFASDVATIRTSMKRLIEDDERAAILEIKTDRLGNDKVLKDYFDYLKSGK